MAAVLAGGEEAVLSHRSAAALWGLLKSAGRRPEVTVKSWRRSGRNLHFHCSVLPADEVGRHGGIPVTTVARTLSDIAPTLTPTRLKSAIDAAESQLLTGPLSLPDLLERYPRRRGTAALKRILAEDRLGADVPREELELRFAEFGDRFGLPRPAINKLVEVGGAWLEIDCVWESKRVVVELDSRRHHDNSTAFEEDRARDQALIADGWRVMRVTWKQLREEPQGLARGLNQTLATPA